MISFQNHARTAAKTIAGKKTKPFNKVAIFWSANGQQLRYAGTGKAKYWKDIIVQGEPDELKFIAYYLGTQSCFLFPDR